jgi:hypothetical protein
VNDKDSLYEVDDKMIDNFYTVTTPSGKTRELLLINDASQIQKILDSEKFSGIIWNMAKVSVPSSTA